MRNRNLATRVIWFVLGVLVAASVGVVNARRTPPEPQSLTLEERVTKLEKRVDGLAEAVSKKMDEPKPDRSRN